MASGGGPSNGDGSGPPSSVLLVEDDASDAMLLTTYVRRFEDPLEVTHRRALREALELLGHPFEVIHTDLNLRNRRLELEAQRDFLTGLLTRRAFEMSAEGIIAAVGREGTVLAVFVDVNSFTGINDTHGHEIGDIVLRSVATRLQGCVRLTDLVTRWGGDEFVMLGRANDKAVVERLLARIREEVSFVLEPEQVPGLAQPIVVRCSVGAALSDSGTETLGSLIRRADVRMYADRAGQSAKEDG